MTFPTTLLAFQERFPDEQACWRTLRRMRWPHGFRCPRCRHRKSYRLAVRRLEQCQRCRYQASKVVGNVCSCVSLHRFAAPPRARQTESLVDRLGPLPNPTLPLPTGIQRRRRSRGRAGRRACPAVTRLLPIRLAPQHDRS